MKKIYILTLSLLSAGIVAQTSVQKPQDAGFDENKYLQIAKERNIPPQDIAGYISAERHKYIQAQHPELYHKKENVMMVDLSRHGNDAVQVNYCPNSDFSYLAYTNWTGEMSTNCIPGTQYPVPTWNGTGINGNNGSNVLINTDPCNNSTDFQVIMNTQIGPQTNNQAFAMNNGYDPNCKNPSTGFYDLPMVPYGATSSVRLGSAYSNYTSQKLVYAVTPTALRSLFTYQFAVVIDDGSHPVGEQPAFLFAVKDVNGNLITGVNQNCVQYNIDATGASTDTSYIKANGPCAGWDVYYRKWRTVTIDLTSQIGNTVYAEFQAVDCPWSGHYCYGYISAKCEAADVHVSMCAGTSSQFLSAPKGFNQYQWYDPNLVAIPGANSDTLTTYGNLGDTYTVDCITLQGCTTKLTANLNPGSLDIYYYNGSISGFFSGTGNVNMCSGNNMNLLAIGANTYTWSASAGGSNNDTVNVTPTLSSLTYSVIGTSQNGCIDSASISFTLDTSGCVWPGDADENLVVDNLDLLQVGLKWGLSGPARSFLSSLWYGYPCNDWNDTLQSGINTKYVDCNGSGIIEMGDTLPVYVNYNATHTFKMQSPNTVQAGNPDIYLVFNKTLYYPGDTLYADVMAGTSANPQMNFYGAAFSIDYEETKTKTGSEKFNFNNSFMGTINTDYIKLEKVFTGTGYVDASAVRIGHTDVNGFGKVAQLTLILKDTLNGNGWMYFTTSGAVKTSSLGELTNMNTGTDSVAVAVNGIGIAQNKSVQSLSVFPNPSAGNFVIRNSVNMDEIKVCDILGNTVLEARPNANKFNLSLDTEGVYFIRVKSGKETLIRKVIVSK